jgi:hypothetical protein
MGSGKSWLVVAAVIAILVAGGLLWDGRSAMPQAAGNPQPVAQAHEAATPTTNPPQPPVMPTVADSKPGVDAKPATPARPENHEAAALAHREAKDRQIIARRYGALFDELNLNPTQREQLTRLLIDEREASADYAGAAAAGGTDASQDPKAFGKSVRELRGELQEQMEGVLGEETFARFLAGEAVIKRAAVLERAQSALQGTGAELTGTQSHQLDGILRELNVHSVNAEVIARASGFLSDEQLQVLQELEAQRARGVAKDRVQKAIRKNKP